MAAERAGQYAKAKTLFAKVSDTSLAGYVEAQHFISASPKSLTAQELVDWLTQYRDLAVADRIYRLAVAHSTRKERHHHKTILVAVVTNIPVPSGVGRRTGGYEDLELPEPMPASDAAKGVMPGILAAIKAGQPDQALALMQSVQATCTPADNAIPLAIIKWQLMVLLCTSHGDSHLAPETNQRGREKAEDEYEQDCGAVYLIDSDSDACKGSNNNKSDDNSSDDGIL